MVLVVLCAGILGTLASGMAVAQFSFTEDFQSGLDGWTAKVYGQDGGGGATIEPMIFTFDDPFLWMNTNNPGSHSAGFSSFVGIGKETAAWIQRQFAIGAGTHDIQIEMDLYVYYGDTGASPDPWGVGNRIYVLTDDQYNDTSWDFQGDPSPGFRVSYWPGWREIGGVWQEDWSYNGVWEHVIIDRTVATATGNIELRLLLHDKNRPFEQAVAWDNVVLRVNGKEIMSEDFESGLGSWEARMYGPPNNDAPTIFTTTDVRLYDNLNNPGTEGAGYSSDIPYDGTIAEWIQKQFPNAVAAGDYLATLEMDVYVYRLDLGDPWGVGNRVYVLTDFQYDDPTWDFDHGDPTPGFAEAYWPADTDPNNSGTWKHVSVQRRFHTDTGNIEIRLLQHDKGSGAQAVAWDNVNLTLGAAPPPLAITSTSPLPDGQCGQPYSYQFTGTGVGELSWSLVDIQPAIASLQLSSDGLLTFTAVETEITSYLMTVQLTDTVGPPVQQEFVLTVVGPCGPACNATPQDTDGDQDVDLTDFGVFQSCFNGPNRPYNSPQLVEKCKCLDVDPDDGDVDLTDFGKFQSCFNGPNRPPQATCS